MGAHIGLECEENNWKWDVVHIQKSPGLSLHSQSQHKFRLFIFPERPVFVSYFLRYSAARALTTPYVDEVLSNVRSRCTPNGILLHMFS